MPEVTKDGKCINWIREITCRQWDEYDKMEGCGAVLRITEDDFVPMYYKGTHFPHHYIAVQCPQCKKYVHVGKIPPPIMRRFWTDEREEKAIFDGCVDLV